MADPSDYTVGWICAVFTEYVAAKEFLDEKHSGMDDLPPNDNNDYTLGRIGRHNVVIAALPTGEYGTSSATSVAKDMIRSFPNIRIGLMVGIAGGAPSKQHDIRLGDVVVGIPDGGLGGVFQYDFGKTIQDKSFQPTGFQNQAPTIFRTAVTGLRGDYESDGHQLEDAIQAIIQKKPRLKKRYQRPDPTTDQLYQSEIAHRDGEELSCAEKCGNDSSTLVQRRERTEEDDDPEIHYGVIASGNQLMKDAKIRDKLAAEKGVLCFEMEAAGLMNHFPCLVVRGICDYSDSHKNKEWQGYAAMTAAAYAKDVLCRIAPTKVQAEKRLAEALSPIKDGIDRILQAQYDAESMAILDWLCAVDYMSKQNDFIRRRQTGTGQWLLDSPEYKSWIKGDEKTLFCPGIPGAGKTIATSIVVEDLEKQFHDTQDVGIAYLYCNFNESKEQTAENLLSNLLGQLIRQQSIPTILKDLYNNHKAKHTRLSLEDIITIFHSVISHFSTTFLIIDALDECQDTNRCRQILSGELFKLQARGVVKIFATSRFIPEIEDQFKGCASLEVRATKEDVERYIDGKITNLRRFVQDNEDLKASIKEEITRTVDGMFLLAQLHLQSLEGLMSVRDIRTALSALPSGSGAYDLAYDEAMARIGGQLHGEKKIAKKVLCWIYGAHRPLRISELQHAIATEAGDVFFDPDSLIPADDLVSVCAGLVTVDYKSDIIRLVHYTAQQYFEQTRDRWFQGADVDMATICVTYLSFDEFEQGPYGNQEELQIRHQSFPLYRYAAKFWGEHMREKLIAEELLFNFFQSQSKIDYFSQVYFDYQIHTYNGLNGLHFAACFGNSEMATSFLNNGIDINAQDGSNLTALSWACIRGHLSIVKLLLDTGKVETNPVDGEGSTPLFHAIEHGHGSIVRLLLIEGKADINHRNRYNATPLIWTIGGDAALTKFLLDEGKAEPDLADDYNRSPLSWAAIEGNVAAMKLLIETGNVDINSRDSDGLTPLSHAVRSQHDSAVKFLLETGKVDCNPKDNTGSTPLLWAAERGFDSTVLLLVNEETIEVNKKDMKGRTPLMLAALSGHESTIKILRNEGKAHINVKDIESEMSLLQAARGGYGSIVKLLLHSGEVDANLGDNDGKIPLLWAARNGYTNIVKLLLDSGEVNADSRDNNGRTPLSFAAENCHHAIFELLLKTGKVDANSRDNNGQTPLSWAAGSPRTYGRRGEVIAEVFLELDDIDLDAKDNEGQTPFLLAAKNMNEAFFDMLLKTGKVDIDSRDLSGRTPLSWATMNGDFRLFARLVNSGKADPDSRDNNGRTPLSWTTESGRCLYASMLLKTGKVDVDSKDKDGRTPLSWAANYGHKDIVKLLLKTGKVDINAMDTEGRTPLSWAEMNGHSSIVELLKSHSLPASLT